MDILSALKNIRNDESLYAVPDDCSYGISFNKQLGKFVFCEKGSGITYSGNNSFFPTPLEMIEFDDVTVKKKANYPAYKIGDKFFFKRKIFGDVAVINCKCEVIAICGKLYTVLFSIQNGDSKIVLETDVKEEDLQNAERVSGQTDYL